MPTLPLYRELGIEVLLRGHAGELMHMNKAYNFSVDHDALAIQSDAALEEWLLRHLSGYMLDGIDGPLLRRASRRELDQLSRESLRTCLQDCQRTNPPVQRIWQLFLNQRLRRETATAMVEFHSLVETRMPFLDHELVDLLLALPPEWKISDRIQHHILARHKPEFLRIINANIGSPMTAGPLRRLFGQARLKVFAKLGVRGYQPYERLGLWLRRELRPLVEKLLLSDRFADRGVFEPQTVRRTVQAHFDGRNHTYLLLALMIFETAQRQFVDGERQPTTAAQAVAV
jgi:asparagine synthetase B (glutamine-hydrolysing)